MVYLGPTTEEEVRLLRMGYVPRPPPPPPDPNQISPSGSYSAAPKFPAWSRALGREIKATLQFWFWCPRTQPSQPVIYDFENNPLPAYSWRDTTLGLPEDPSETPILRDK